MNIILILSLMFEIGQIFDVLLTYIGLNISQNIFEGNRSIKYILDKKYSFLFVLLKLLIPIYLFFIANLFRFFLFFIIFFVITTFVILVNNILVIIKEVYTK